MAIAKIEPLPTFDLGTKMVPWKQRHAEGKELRRAIPRESHAEWKPGTNRPDPLKLLAISNKGRQAHLEFLTGATFNFYAWACGAILARAHGRTGDPARYCRLLR